MYMTLQLFVLLMVNAQEQLLYLQLHLQIFRHSQTEETSSGWEGRPADDACRAIDIQRANCQLAKATNNAITSMDELRCRVHNECIRP
jgi:hypothetical protein